LYFKWVKEVIKEFSIRSVLMVKSHGIFHP
jgi:hypothetical protein